jgi:ribosome-associated protein
VIGVTLQTPAALARAERSLILAKAAAQAAADNRGQDVVVLDLREQTPIFDYFVLATGSSQRQLRAMADAVDDVLQKDFDQLRLSRDGYDGSTWIVLDFGAVVVHFFDTTSREFYRLEDLWGGAVPIPWKEAQ